MPGDPGNPALLDYFEMSGTSMAAPVVSATAALMVEQDPSLNPGTVKARLMMSARKAKFGDPLVTGAGYLDIMGALRSTCVAADALLRSPCPTSIQAGCRSRTPRRCGATRPSPARALAGQRGLGGSQPTCNPRWRRSARCGAGGTGGRRERRLA
jgi:hypothetical protein